MNNDDTLRRVADELAAIKQLLIIALLRDGVQQSQIAGALGVSGATVSRLFPKDLAKTIIKSPRDTGR